MTTEKGAQFSFEECFCAEMMAQFGGTKGDSECLELMSQMMSICCGAEQESDESGRKA
jgi:hypothetical protein